jgi:hypothetical protein
MKGKYLCFEARLVSERLKSYPRVSEISARQENLRHPVLHFLPVFDFISHFYQLYLVSCLFVNRDISPFLILHYYKTKKARAFYRQMHAVQFMSTAQISMLFLFKINNSPYISFQSFISNSTNVLCHISYLSRKKQ